MKEFTRTLLGLLVVLMLALAGCGGGGGGGSSTTPTATDIDGDGVPNTEDAFPNDATKFASFTTRQISGITGSTFSAAVDINGTRQVVGMSDTGASQELRAVLWNVAADGTPSPTIELNPLGGNAYSAAYGINDTGITVGESSDNTDTVAVFWSSGSQNPTKLQLLAATGPSAAFKISNTGRIVGEALNGSAKSVAVLWNTATSAPLELPRLSGGTTSAAYFITADGTRIVGESENSGGSMRGVVWQVATNGTVGNPTELGILPGHVTSVALGMNAAGQIVGESESASGEVHAVIWTEGILGGLFGYNVKDMGPAGARSSASAINDTSRIAGWMDAPASAASLWHALNALNVATPLSNAIFAQGVVSQAYGINSGGYVVGMSQDRAFVAVPTAP